MSRRSPPATLRVRVAPGTLILDQGRLLLGGAPGRLVRLKPGGAEAVRAWRSGDAVGTDPAVRSLARRLLDGGLLVPDPAPGRVDTVAVVVPTHGRAGQLDRCLQAVRETAPDVALVVVDDGSPDAAAVQQIARAHGATLVRHPLRRGAAAARNTGAMVSDRPLLAFVDSDVVVEPGCLARLSGAFADAATGAVAPRVRSLGPVRGLIGTYESRRSALDMGPQASAVRRRGAVPYLPSTTLVVRRAAFTDGFDERLEIGEDVDFIWRLCDAGWNVWYDPSVEVRHAHRTSPAGFVTRRFEYAASIGPLAVRHPDALPALWADSGVGIVAIAVIGRPLIAAGLAIAAALGRAHQLRGRTAQPLLLAVHLGARSYQAAGRNLARAVRRAWWPVLAPVLIGSRRGRILLACAWTHGLLETGRPSLSQAGLAVADDLIATAGTWWSCLRCRTLTPLLPARDRPAAPSLRTV